MSATLRSYSGPIQVHGRTLLYSIVHDITERKVAEQALSESREHYRSLFENMLNGYAYCKMIYEGETPVDFVFTDVNPAFETLTGLRTWAAKKSAR